MKREPPTPHLVAVVSDAALEWGRPALSFTSCAGIILAGGLNTRPLCAVYAKRCAPVIEGQLRGGDLKIANLFGRTAVKKIPYEHFLTVDEHLVSFFNIDTEDDLTRAQTGDFPDIV